nr:hypothetical protein [Odoribacter splanchnicus]
METTELFILFPEYKEAPDKTGSYLEADTIMGEDEMYRYIQEIEDVNNFFTHEEYCGYYDRRNVKAFLYPLNELEECYPDHKTYLRSILKNWEDWRDGALQAGEDRFRFEEQFVSDDTLCEVAKRKSVHADCAYLVVNHRAFQCSDEFVTVECNGIVYKIDMYGVERKKLSVWFVENRRPKRVYNWNPKHGEFGKGAYSEHRGEEVSVLLGSRKEAGDLLKKAIGKYPFKRLFSFDNKYHSYMEYKQEIGVVYHSFHIKDEQRVPEEIKRKIKFLESCLI